MDQATLERAFEPFFSTKETGQGTGLGLSQVYGFAKQSGGFAVIDSRVGHGTSVKIYLPRTSLALTTQIAEHDTADANMGGGEAILIVEDDEQVRRYIVETLLELNYRVVEARDAVEANNVFKHSERTIDLLLTDVVMPGKNGRILSEELVRLNPELKVLFMTGYSRDAIVHHGRLDAGVFLLQKPITQRDLAKKVRSLLGPSTAE